MWVKICGITSAADADAAVAAGADAIGINVWPHSRRAVDVPTARAVAAAVRGRAAVVAVSVDLALPALRALRAAVPCDWLQLHGDEPEAVLAALQPQAFRAVGLAAAADVARARDTGGPWVLVDAADPQHRGGTGRRPPWALAAEVCRLRRTVLAGGLTPANVAAAIAACAPVGVDVSSGVEAAATPRRKDAAKMHAFVAAARGGG